MPSNKQEYQNNLLHRIKSINKPIALMEVCGTHTMAIAKSGLRELVPADLRLLSGPGCPVCVTSQSDIDSMINLVRDNSLILATFGDMIRVPGSSSSLQLERSQGADVRIVYSPLDALELARRNPGREVVFLGIGFETTTPAVAATMLMAEQENLDNFSLLSFHKTVPPALELICNDPELSIDGLICPGHVAAVTGIAPFAELAAKHDLPCVITGFETLDIIEGIVMLLDQIDNQEAQAQIQYQRIVKPEGNPTARQISAQVFEAASSPWRGLGVLEHSGLKLRSHLAKWDAKLKFDLSPVEEIAIKGCACGAILTAKSIPTDCALFARACTPNNPIGPCMVSQEGACSAYYRFQSYK